MSHEAVTYVKLHSKQRCGAYTVLLMIAEEQRQDGAPRSLSYKDLAAAARLDPRQAKRIVLGLAVAGEIDVEWSNGGGNNRYLVAMSAELTKANCDKMSQLLPSLTASRKNKTTKANCDKMSQSTKSLPAQKCHSSELPNCDKMSQLKPVPPSENARSDENETVIFCHSSPGAPEIEPNCDISAASTVTFSTPNCDISDTGNGGKGGAFSGESSGPVKAPVKETGKEFSPPQTPPPIGETLGPRTKTKLPKHEPEEARRFWKRHPVKDDPERFSKAWDKRKPSKEQIATAQSHLDIFEGVTLTEEQKTGIVGASVYVYQQRWGYDVPFKGFNIVNRRIEIEERERNRPPTLAQEQTAKDAALKAREEEAARNRAERQEAERKREREQAAAIDARIAALAPERLAWLEKEALKSVPTEFRSRSPDTVKKIADPIKRRLFLQMEESK